MHYNKPLLLLAILFVIETCIAQTYNFKNYSVNEGLASQTITCIQEDYWGHIWIGTERAGIIKHDGHTFQSFGVSEGLHNPNINSICQRSNKDIWIGTHEGIFIYRKNKITAYKNSQLNPKEQINIIKEDDSGFVWIGTEKSGLLKVSKDTTLTFTTKNGLYSNTIKSIYVARGCCIWIGTQKGLNKYKNGKILRIPQKYEITNSSVNGICKDTLGNYWFSTENSSAFYYDGKKFWNYTVLDGLMSNNLTSVFSDKKGNIWVGSDLGLMRFTNNEFKYYTEDNGLGSNHITCFYQDQFQNLWIGTKEGGISKFDNEKFIHYAEERNFGRRVYSIAQAPNSNLVFATSEGGISVYDGEKFILLKGISGFTYSDVNKLHYSKDQSLWIATNGDGVYKFDNFRFKRYSMSDGLASNKISDVTIDKDGNTWAGSLNNGLSLIPADSSRKITTFSTSDSLMSNKVNAVVVDSMNNLWVATSKGLNKIYRLNKKNFKVEKIADFNILSIAIDTSGNLFLGTTQGIKIYDGKAFSELKKEHGLQSNNINLLSFDKNGRLWAGCEQGIHKIKFDENRKTSTIQFYGKNEGFKGIGTLLNSYCIDIKGNLWFGTLNGAVKYNPKEDHNCTIPPRLQITSIKLFFNKIEDTEYADSLWDWRTATNTLKLPHHQNNLSFEFSGIYHPNPDAVKYKWKLKGFDDDWSPVLKQKEATYSNLPSGKYTFKVMACNENGIWTEKPVEFKFEIMKPYWEEWWFKGSSIAAGAIFLWIVFFIRLRQIKQKNKAAQQKLQMEKDLIELEQEASRLQMNPHFIFNSLNSIQGFIATNDSFQAKRYLAKFARLMRLILENSREEYIPLENEIETLENYLELEKLRLNDKFNYEIEVEPSIEPDVLELPPMLIQPFLENSIIHGLKYKEGKGKIEVIFSLNNGILVCEIEDNGIGREKAMANRSTNNKHKSTGMNVTSKRLKQLNLQTGKIAGFKIIDLKNENEIPCGTKVIIHIPIEGYEKH